MKRCNQIIYQITINTLTIADIVTFEVTLANGKKVLISCVYREPNTIVDMLSDFIIAILRNNRNKIIYVCGDFNIN